MGIEQTVLGGDSSEGTVNQTPFVPVNIDSPFGDITTTQTATDKLTGAYTVGGTAGTTGNSGQIAATIGEQALAGLQPGNNDGTAALAVGETAANAGINLGAAFDETQALSYGGQEFTQNPDLLASNTASAANISGQANQAGSIGQLNNQFKGLETDILAKLRSGVAGDNNFAASSKISSLLNSGKLGVEGGARQLRGLDEAQRKQDLGFQLSSMDFSRGLQDQFQNQLNAGSNAEVNRFNAVNGFEQGMFERGAGLEQLGVDRSEGRLNQLSQMFGFGNDLDQQALDNALKSLEAEGITQNQWINFLNASTNAAGVATTQPVVTNSSSTSPGLGGFAKTFSGIAAGAAT
jgi:hypothetical protein